MIDTHMHVDTRPYEDFESMAMAGITDVLTLAHDPMRMSHSLVLADHFERLFFERERVERHGIRLHVCLGIHPRAKPSDIDAAIGMLDALLGQKTAIAIGEIGLETGDPEEVFVFRRQVEMASKHGLPVIVHTPRKDKQRVTSLAIDELSAFTIPKGSVVIDHADRVTVRNILDSGYNAGLTVQPGKLTPEEAAAIVRENDHERIVLNTDASSNRTDVLGVPRTALRMRLDRVDEHVIDSVSRRNAKRIFRI